MLTDLVVLQTLRSSNPASGGCLWWTQVNCCCKTLPCTIYC